MNRKIKKIAIVGAGPAGLFCAYNLISHSLYPLSITMYEMGDIYENRKCLIPINKGKCHNCDSCHQIYGFGGSALFHNIRLSLYPAGSGIWSIVGNNYFNLQEKALRLWNKSLKIEENIINHISSLSKISSHGYHSIPMLKVNCREIGSLFYELIRKTTFLHTNCEVLDVKKYNKCRWRVNTIKGFDVFDYVILSVGKTKRDFLNKVVFGNSIQTVANFFEFGLRIEFPDFPRKFISSGISDYKIKIDLEKNVSARTYCWLYPGESICVNNNGIVSLDGQPSFNFNKRLSFAILVRIKSNNLLFHDGIISLIKENQKSYFSGLPVCESLFSFLNKKTVKFRYPDQNYSYISGKVNRLYQNELTNLLQKTIRMIGIDGWENADEAIVLAPCFEREIPIPILNYKHECTRKGLFFIGDCTGRYRGALQASIAGIAASEEIINRF